MADKPFGDIDAELIMVGAKSGLRPDLSSIERRHGKHLADTIKSCWEADGKALQKSDKEKRKKHTKVRSCSMAPS